MELGTWNPEPATSPPAVAAAGVVKRFGDRAVLRDVSLTVAAGGTYCLYGPNGSGKSTLLRILATLTAPSAGEVRVLGLDARRQPIAVRARVGYVGHQGLLYGALSARQNLEFFARMYGLRAVHGRVDELLDLLELRRWADEPARYFSRGMQQRLSLARALLHDPAVLLLDEPYAGLDQRAQDILDEVVARRVSAGKTVILASHDLLHPRAAYDRSAVLARGMLWEWPGEESGSLIEFYRRKVAA